MQLFKILVQYTNAEEKFAYIFFKEELSIIDYKFSQPKKISGLDTPVLIYWQHMEKWLRVIHQL